MIDNKLKESSIVLNKAEKQEIINQIMESQDASPLIQARYIRTGLGDKFVDVISHVLYKNIVGGGVSDLMNAIAQISMPKRNALGLRGVITFNFDDILEANLRSRHIPYYSIYSDTDTCSSEYLPIYHVHGYLPRNANDIRETANSLLVFSEEGYHAVIIDPYHWSNIIQLNYLRENTCLMVGLSLTDPNLRRLLAIAARKLTEPKHYAILKRQNVVSTGKAASVFVNVDQKLQEESFRELGLKIIWVDDYDEIPGMLISLSK